MDTLYLAGLETREYKADGQTLVYAQHLPLDVEDALIDEGIDYERGTDDEGNPSLYVYEQWLITE